jgi:3-methyladenine DNA glycosylase AlkD
MIKPRIRLRKTLRSLAEESYREFASSLIPEPVNMLGVRLPILRKLARKELQGQWRELLSHPPESPFTEETMLDGIIIGCADMPTQERLNYIDAFLPRISNWSLCDSFCSGLKFARKEQESVWTFLLSCLRSPSSWNKRFAYVMMLLYFLNDNYIDAVLRQLTSCDETAMHVVMSVGWALTECYIRYPERTLVLLQSPELPEIFFKSAIRKITESGRVSAEEKEFIRKLKTNRQAKKPDKRIQS